MRQPKSRKAPVLTLVRRGSEAHLNHGRLAKDGVARFACSMPKPRCTLGSVAMLQRTRHVATQALCPRFLAC
jgi:hypothetical protein